jgi:GNAT superfamily N-acetyltransferase
MNSKIQIHPLIEEDIIPLSDAFTQIGWNKPPSLFAGYLKEIEAGERLVWVARVHDKFAGYVTLKWQSGYQSFKEQNIPEIMDLNILPASRKMGIGSLLLDIAEEKATAKSKVVGIGVGLYAGEDGGYGVAQRLYVKRGYIPDGKGITYNYKTIIPGHFYPINDDLVLWFTKEFDS